MELYTNRIVNLGSELIDAVDLLKMKADLLEHQHKGTVENVNVLKDTVKEQGEWVNGLVKLAEEQDRTIKRLKAESVLSGIAIIILGITLMVFGHKLEVLHGLLYGL